MDGGSASDEPEPGTQRFALDLTKEELTVLNYVISAADSPYASDPLKDTYELGDDEPEDPYAVLKTMAKKIYKLNWQG